jgi:hypothetical protein
VESDNDARTELMALTAGTRIGLYEIPGALGKGAPAFAERGVPPQLRVLRSHARTAR